MPTQSSAGSVTILRCIDGAKRATKTWRLLTGEPLPDIDLNQPVRRKKKPDEAGRCWFRDVSGGLCWVLLDFDKVTMPAAVDVIADPEGAVLYLASLLPACCQDISFHWQLS